MGYTHYFQTKRDISVKHWNNIVLPGVRQILETAQGSDFKIPLVGSAGEPGTEPALEEELILFNGLDRDSHETMEIRRCELDFYFCKTARKPYDSVCVALAIFMQTCFTQEFSWHSDGDYDKEDCKLEGIRLLVATFGTTELSRENILAAIKKKAIPA